MTASTIAKTIARKLGLRVSRNRPENRFDAVEACLSRMKALGWSPDVVIDVGANRGQFYRLVRPIFPEAAYHLVEPQPACNGSLRQMARLADRVETHHVALSEPGVTEVRLLGGGTEGGSTGAFVAHPGEHDEHEVAVPATTLDALVSHVLEAGKHALLKIDAEGHEVAVLQGSVRSLRRVEVILVEVWFFDVGNRDQRTFPRVLRFLEERGFLLYDIAALAGRPGDMRLRQGDLIFVRDDLPLVTDNSSA